MNHKVVKKITGYAILTALAVLAAIALTSCPNNLMEALQEELETGFNQSSYTLTVEASTGGSVSPAGNRAMKPGDVLNITATPDGGNQFMSWQKTGGIGTVGFGNIGDSDTTVTLSNGDATVQAIFGNQPRTLTVTAGSNGSISTPPSSPVTIPDGTSYGIVAVPDSGYDFDSWSQIGGAGSVSFTDTSSASTSITLSNGNAEIQASFTPKTYTLTLTVSNASHGHIEFPAASTVQVTHGVSQTIRTSNPDARGYYFSGWSKIGGSGTEVFADSSNRSTQVTISGGNVQIRATYTKITASLPRRGIYNLESPSIVNRKMDTPRDLVYENGYVYISGKHGSAVKLLKIDVSNLSNITFSNYQTFSGASDAREIVKDGSYMYVAVQGSGYGVRRIPFSSFGSGTLTINKANISNITPNGWYESYNFIYKSSSSYSYPDDQGSDDPDYVHDIFYANGLLFVSYEIGDMGGSGIFRSVDNTGQGGTPEMKAELDMDEIPGNITWPGDIYMYTTADVDGILTFYIDDASDYLRLDDVEGTSTTTGNETKDIGVSGSNYLVTSGTNDTYSSHSYDKLNVYDIHWNNGSDGEPYWIASRNSAYSSQDISSIYVEGRYIYALEGHYLVVYEIITNTN